MSVPVLVVFALLVTMADTTVSIHDVVLVSASTNYSGPCPAKIPVTLSLDGDPQTIFRWQVVGDVVTPTKRSYGFVPPEGSVSVNVDIPVDAPPSRIALSSGRCDVWHRSAQPKSDSDH